MLIISIDIGSTWTKGALFRLSNDLIYPVARAMHRTTIDGLELGFNVLLDELTEKVSSDKREQKIPIVYSSSAKGGLTVAAIGLVPNLTLEATKSAAYSAGARISQCYAYDLSSADIRELEASSPDIVLLTGGTDGGNSHYVIGNAKALAGSTLQCPIIYAGNRSLVDRVAVILSDRELYVVDNILPSMDTPVLEPVREKIRSVFVDKIIYGKGLDLIAKKVGTLPLPTPYVVHDLLQHISENVVGWNDFMLLDLGGATTDVYSQYHDPPELGTVYRGLKEPKLKRTVEGDLGMRVSASSVAKTYFSEVASISSNDVDIQVTQQIRDYVSGLKERPHHISSDKEEEAFDSMIAQCCILNATMRHAGRCFTVHTAEGPVRVQLGRNLDKVPKLIGTGGYLANNTELDAAAVLSQIQLDEKGQEILLPQNPKYFRDDQYLIPLFANIARLYPKQAAIGAVAYLDAFECEKITDYAVGGA